MTLEEAIQLKEILEELVADPHIDFGPAYEGAKTRQANALRIIQREIKELKHEPPSRAEDTYDACVERAKKRIGAPELWIFEDTEGAFHAVGLSDSQKTFEHYALAKKWIPRGRVFAETKVVTMWTGGVLGHE